jgi:hypothetical protein
MLKELGENVFNAIILNIWMIRLVCVIIVQETIKKQWIVCKIINKYKNRDKNRDRNKDKDKNKNKDKDLVKNYNNQSTNHNKMILKMAFNLTKMQIKNTN